MFYFSNTWNVIHPFNDFVLYKREKIISQKEEN